MFKTFHILQLFLVIITLQMKCSVFLVYYALGEEFVTIGPEETQKN